MGVEIVGRSAEQAAIERFVAGVVAPGPVGSGPLGLAISGEAGIGKSSLWLRAVEEARGAGALVLETRPAAPDLPVSYSGFVDLLDAAVDDVLGELPGPQQVALEIALYRRPAGERPEAGIIAVSALHALRLLASRRPLVIAIDDVQWLDGASATAVGYALRRLRDEPVGLVTARRVGSAEARRAPASEERASAGGQPGSPETAADELDALLAEDRVVRIVPGPLPLGAIHHLVRTRLESALPRPVIMSIHRRSAGNPFFALELARYWLANGEPTPSLQSSIDTIPSAKLASARPHRSPLSGPTPERPAVDGLPASLRDALTRRLDGLPAPSRRPLAIIAIAGQASIEVVAAVDDKPVEAVADALESARRGGVVEDLGDRLRIGHPLLAEAIIDAATAAERRNVHRRLADLATDPEERARHLAAIGNSHDRETADALAAAAESAAARGATAASRRAV